MKRTNSRMLSFIGKAPVRHILAIALLTSSSSGIAQGVSVASTSSVPPPPTNLVGFATFGVNQSPAVVLQWTRSPTATSYQVFIGTTPGGEFDTPIATVLGPRAEVRALKAGADYYFTVKAHNSSGDSTPSGEFLVATLCNVSCE